jgi:hypothetical protein
MGKAEGKNKMQKHTTAGIRGWSPTQLLICRYKVCVQESGRDPLFPLVLWSYVEEFLLISFLYYL